MKLLALLVFSSLILFGCTDRPAYVSPTPVPTSTPTVSAIPTTTIGPQPGVRILTDKLEYASNEEVRVMIKNDLPFAVFLAGCNQYSVVSAASSSELPPFKACFIEGFAYRLYVGATYSDTIPASRLLERNARGEFFVSTSYVTGCSERQTFSDCSRSSPVAKTDSERFVVRSSAASPQPTATSTPSATPLPADYYVCQADSDCVRQRSCCDCGMGVYVNRKYLKTDLACSGPECMCPIQDSVGKCEENRCVAYPANPECTADSDCARGGCSGQVCEKKGSGSITTCEWKDEYTCYQQNSCGCVQGYCNWEDQDALSSCIAKYR